MEKTHYYWMFLLVAALVAAHLSCVKDPLEPEPTLALSIDEWTATNDGGTKEVRITANRAWTASSAESWCAVSPASGSGSVSVITITVTPHTAAGARSTTVSVVAGSLVREITIVQEGADVLDISDSEVDVDVAGGDFTLTVSASGAYEVSALPTWIERTTTGTVQPGQERVETFRVGTNGNVLAREGTVVFVLAGITQKVTIRQAGQPAVQDADKAGMDRDAPALAGQLRIGWNLGNALEAASSPFVAGETLWGNPRTTQVLINAVKGAGFNAVRIPCAWSGYMEDQETFRVSDSWLARVKEVVDYCVANDMYVILNTHWDGGWLEEHPLYAHQEAVTAKFSALWQQIAVYFRDYDEHLLFAGTNEVHADYGTPTAEHLAVQNAYNQTFVNAVRATGGKNAWRNLVVQSYNTNIDHAVTHLKIPTDPVPNRMMVEVHYYDPYDFTLDDKSDKYLWGEAYAGQPNASSWGQEEWVDQAFGKMKTHFVDRGIPVILGEYAAMLRSGLAVGLADHIASRNHYLHYVTAAAYENGVVPFYWDNGHTGNLGSGLFDRAAATPVHTDAIEAIITAIP
ncbi:cellulase family glycosylhydrolase [Parapedobacter soli]|uniref:cellulase family glycosylhydrolase n=1 Tax=Parapedobacter soli TaxID=416955 RepID=UPI0021C9425B|nr:cellulase family glycosylhydrolase [Parapedobacter soli]